MQTILQAENEFSVVPAVHVLDSQHFARAVVQLDLVGGLSVEQRLVKIDAVVPDDVPEPIAAATVLYCFQQNRPRQPLFTGGHIID